MARKVRTPTPAPRGAEIHMDVEKMHALFDAAGASLDHGTATERLIMAGDLAKVAMRAAKAGTPLSVFSWEYGTEALQTALTERLQRFVQHGRRQVADELQRQAAAAANPGKLADILAEGREAAREAEALGRKLDVNTVVIARWSMTAQQILMACSGMHGGAFMRPGELEAAELSLAGRQ